MSDVAVYNLVHQQFWSDVHALDVPGHQVCWGRPPKPLRLDDPLPLAREYVLVSYLNEKWTVERWASAFAAIKAALNLDEEPKRLVMAMVADDSTVIYYIIYNGLVAPQRN